MAGKTGIRIAAGVLFLMSPVLYAAAVFMEADGPGNTYELISSVLGGNPIEVPDCSHPEFGRHISEEWDDFLGKYVFVFHIHVIPDDDRCTNFDRQRNEIKTYGPSPDYLKGGYNEIHTYRWKFKIDSGFQPSPNFTHIFQIKAGDGSDSGAPIITFTPRYGSPETLQLIFTPSSGSSGGGTKASSLLEPFKGEWVEAYVRTLYSETGTIDVLLTRVRDGAVLLYYTNDNLDMWRGDATFNRPKWGIYRSLNSPQYLRDEQVRFSDFCIAKGNDSCPSTEKTFPIESDTPTDQDLVVGRDAIFEVIPVPDMIILSYQWFEVTGSGDLSIGTDSPILSIPNAQETDAGRQFYCQVTTDEGIFSSRTARIRSLDTALVAHLNFDDGSTDDLSGNGNRGTLMNGASIVNDPDRGSVLYLDGVDDYVDLGNDVTLNLSGDGQATLTAWVKISVSKNHNTILSKGEWKDAYSLVIKGDTIPDDLLWTGNDTSVFSADPVPVGIWTHVAVTINGRLATFYVNGQVSGSIEQDRGGPIDNNSTGVSIGREQYSGSLPAGRWFFNGCMEDVRIYKMALCVNEIRQIISGYPAGDINDDGKVDLVDFSYISAQWLTDGVAVPSADIAPSCGDNKVDIQDLMLMVHHFLESTR